MVDWGIFRDKGGFLVLVDLKVTDKGGFLVLVDLKVTDKLEM